MCMSGFSGYALTINVAVAGCEGLQLLANPLGLSCTLSQPSVEARWRKCLKRRQRFDAYTRHKQQPRIARD